MKHNQIYTASSSQLDLVNEDVQFSNESLHFSTNDVWVPLQLCYGIPLFDHELNKQVTFKVSSLLFWYIYFEKKKKKRKKTEKANSEVASKAQCKFIF